MFQIEEAGEGDQAMMPMNNHRQIPPKHDPLNPLNAVVKQNNVEDVFPEYNNKQTLENDNKFSLRPEPIAENKEVSHQANSQLLGNDFNPFRSD